VQGLVTPDTWRLARGGRVIEARTGIKDVAVRLADDAGTREVRLDEPRARAACLDADELTALDALATACERVFPGPLDLEWAFAGGALWLLQCRAITTR